MSLHPQTPPSTPLHRLLITPPSTPTTPSPPPHQSTREKAETLTTATMSTFLRTATPLYPPPPPLTLEPGEITSFYAVDRGIFSRLVAVLRREPKESFHIMAFWVFLEKITPPRADSDDRSTLAQRIAPLDDQALSCLAEESAACLRCIESEFVALDPNRDVLPLMQEISKYEMRLGFFHRNRRWVQEGIRRAIHEVCNRAFEDILRQCYMPGGLALIKNSIQFHGAGRRNGGESSRHGGGEGGAGSRNGGESSRHGGGGEGSSGGSGRRVAAVEEEEREVAPDDRTIFLTFSKGYPITQEELVDFFSSLFGDVFEDIEMEVVGENEQPLYAKMVMRKPSLIPMVLNGQPKARFIIGGRHVWSRKFVKKPKDRRRNR